MSHAAFDAINTRPENEIFRVVFFPDRIYHARYLNATRSERYRYNVREVRGKHDIIVMRGEVYLDGGFISNFIRIEYGGSRLVEQTREVERFVRSRVRAWLRVASDNSQLRAETMVDMHYDEWIHAYQVELWDTLEPPENGTHDFKVLALMGKDGQITRASALNGAIQGQDDWQALELAFREAELDEPLGYRIGDAKWDNNFLRSHQVPNKPNSPSDPANTIEDKNYYLTFQRAFYLNAKDVPPVLYRNAMTDPIAGDPEQFENNVLGMRWLIQNELGSDIVYFHQVEIPPGVTEGTHRHVGSEELYYVIEGEGVIYMGDGDSPDPKLEQYPTVTRNIYGIGPKKCKELPAVPGATLFTKSGGIHGIRNTSKDKMLKFVAFGYQTS